MGSSLAHDFNSLMTLKELLIISLFIFFMCEKERDNF